MAKRNPRHDAAYKVYPGISAEDAEKKGLIVVEWSLATNPPTPIYGEYYDDDAGGIAARASDDDAPAGDKGSLVNPNDPVIHGQPEDGSQHEDGGEPFTKEDSMDALEDAAEAAAEDKPKKK